MEIRELTLKKYLADCQNQFSFISQIIGSLIEKHAMNCVPTDEEMQKLQENTAEIEKNLQKMNADVTQQINTYRNNLDQKAKECAGLTKELTDTYAETDQIKERQIALSSAIEENRRSADYCHMELCRVNNERMELEEQKRKAIQQREEKRSKANKYWWVPGYNIYLGIDLALDDCSEKLQVLSRECDRKQGEIDQFHNDAERFHRELEEKNREYDGLKCKSENLLKHIEAVNENIARTKQEILRWEDMGQRVSELQSKIKAGNMTPESLLDVLNLLEMLKSGALQ